MIDTHAHLNMPLLIDRVDEIVEESRQAGLTGIIIAGSNLEDSKKGIELAKKYPKFLYASVGIHPYDTTSNKTDDRRFNLTQLENLITTNQKNIVAIGECGLDFGESVPGEKSRSKKDQRKLFLGQLKLAQKYNLLIIIHAREAYDEVLEILRHPELGSGSGVFHCYAGGKKRIKQVLDLPGKWYFGIDGNVTYDVGLQNVVAKIPRDRLLLETDSPYLTPEPYRGKQNTSAYLPLIAVQIAKIWGVPVDEVISRTVENTKRLFDI